MVEKIRVRRLGDAYFNKINNNALFGIFRLYMISALTHLFGMLKKYLKIAQMG